MSRKHIAASAGFSLVELSIVLVILGLLVGGILGGQSLIRAAELRNVMVEHQQFETAVNSFRQRYNALPGDFTRAVQFWGDLDNPPSTPTGKETYNGNGDGWIADREAQVYWQQLANAGLIAGTYDPARYWDAEGNRPASKLGGGAYWWIWAGRGVTGGTDARSRSNLWVLAGSTLGYGSQGVITPEEVWGIDVKMDDGYPKTGHVQSGYREYSGDVCADESVTPAEYNVGNTGTVCQISFPRPQTGYGGDGACSDFGWWGDNIYNICL